MENFNPEEFGVPSDDRAKIQAKIDMDAGTYVLNSKLELFEDFYEFFEDEIKLDYLVLSIGKRDLSVALKEINECFVDNELYEKCHKITIWKKMLQKY